MPRFTFFFINRLESPSLQPLRRSLPTEVPACLNGPFHQYLLMEIKGSDRGEAERNGGGA